MKASKVAAARCFRSEESLVLETSAGDISIKRSAEIVATVWYGFRD